MKRASMILVAAVLALTALACSSDDSGDEASDTTETTDATTTEPVDETTTTTEDEDEDEDAGEDGAGDDGAEISDDFPCDLVSSETVADAIGTPVGEGSARPTQNSRNEAEWDSYKCVWEGEGAEQEVDIDVALAEGFESGEVECVEPMSDAITVDGPGTANYWTWNGLLVAAEFQACTDDMLVEVSIDTWDEADDTGALVAATALAEAVIADTTS